MERRHEITRLEAFSDAVFAFALTLLVVSLEVPRSYEALMALMRGFVPFACCFAILVRIWYEHTTFFRRYALDDALSVALNAALLFVVLFYVYPLKYLFTAIFSLFLPAAHQIEPITDTQVGRIMVIYGAGYLAISLLFAALYARSLRSRDALALGPLEVFDARTKRTAHLFDGGVAVLSIAWALLAPARLKPIAGFVYFLIGIVQWIHGARSGRRRAALTARRVPAAGV